MVEKPSKNLDKLLWRCRKGFYTHSVKKPYFLSAPRMPKLKNSATIRPEAILIKKAG